MPIPEQINNLSDFFSHLEQGNSVEVIGGVEKYIITKGASGLLVNGEDVAKYPQFSRISRIESMIKKGSLYKA